MRLRTITDIERFRNTINSCSGAVWLESAIGDKFDLKSVFSQYIAIGRLIEDHNEELEIFASLPEDGAKILAFLKGKED